MRNALEKANRETSGAKAYLLALYFALAGNLSLVIALAGVVLIALGATLLSGVPVSTLEHGVFAAMFGVWGAALVLIGAAARGVLVANQLYARLEADSS